MNQDTKDVLFGFLMLAGLSMIIVAGIMVTKEIYNARSFCKSIDGDYDLKLLMMKHYCDGDEIAHYTDGWDFISYRSFDIDWGKIK